MKLPPSPGKEAANFMPLVAVLSQSGSAFSVLRKKILTVLLMPRRTALQNRLKISFSRPRMGGKYRSRPSAD